jgi:transposase InsO family protein
MPLCFKKSPPPDCQGNNKNEKKYNKERKEQKYNMNGERNGKKPGPVRSLLARMTPKVRQLYCIVMRRGQTSY